jgi:chromosome partitioning protein
MFGAQIHEREAYRAIFAFGGTLADLEPSQVSNLPAARLNARTFAGEVIEMLKATTNADKEEKTQQQHEEVA